MADGSMTGVQTLMETEVTEFYHLYKAWKARNTNRLK